MRLRISSTVPKWTAAGLEMVVWVMALGYKYPWNKRQSMGA